MGKVILAVLIIVACVYVWKQCPDNVKDFGTNGKVIGITLVKGSLTSLIRVFAEKINVIIDIYNNTVDKFNKLNKTTETPEISNQIKKYNDEIIRIQKEADNLILENKKEYQQNLDNLNSSEIISESSKIAWREEMLENQRKEEEIKKKTLKDINSYYSKLDNLTLAYGKIGTRKKIDIDALLGAENISKGTELVNEIDTTKK